MLIIKRRFNNDSIYIGNLNPYLRLYLDHINRLIFKSIWINKESIIIDGSKHLFIYFIKEDSVQIGCIKHSVDTWLLTHEYYAKNYLYGMYHIVEYFNYYYFCKKLLKIKEEMNEKEN